MHRKTLAGPSGSHLDDTFKDAELKMNLSDY